MNQMAAYFPISSVYSAKLEQNGFIHQTKYLEVSTHENLTLQQNKEKCIIHMESPLLLKQESHEKVNVLKVFLLNFWRRLKQETHLKLKRKTLRTQFCIT